MPYASTEDRTKAQRQQKRRKAIARVASDLAYTGECAHGHAHEHRRRTPGGKSYCNECERLKRRAQREGKA